MDNETTSSYIRENFEQSDRLAVVLLSRATGLALQRITTAERITSSDYQAWLRYMNSKRYDVYISMNSLKDGAQHRTKADVGYVRHVFLDFDENGTVGVRTLLQRTDIPRPNYLVNSSSGKWQVIWRIQGCEKEAAEDIERSLVRISGADPVVIDLARVLRLPGFYNQKYAKPYYISVERLSEDVSTSDQFPRILGEERVTPTARTSSDGSISQSERDWAYVRYALRNGAEPEALTQELAGRRSDKFNPGDYARRTVHKAMESLGMINLERAPRSDAGEFER